MNSEDPQRLQKFLARAGVASRRACEQLILSGRVTVNGAVVTELGTKVNPQQDTVALDGQPVALPQTPAVIMLHKPKAVLTTMDDPQGRPTVASLVPLGSYPGLFPVGRLDSDTTGLLLFTNDGELGNSLIHPRHHVEKTYLALVQGVPGEQELRALEGGVMLEDGPTLPARARILEQREAHRQAQKLGWKLPSNSRIVELTITEGRNRQVRRMLATVGHPVQELHRQALGTLALGDLEPGKWRLLTDSEVSRLGAS